MPLTPEQRAAAFDRGLNAPEPSPEVLARLAVFFREPDPPAEMAEAS